MNEPRELDLHGLRVESALRFLVQELTYCRSRGIRELLVIVGRGWHSPGQRPVLGPAVRAWVLSPEGRAHGVVNCRPTARGGALLLRLRG